MVTFDSMKDDLKDLNLTKKDIIRIVEKYCECKSPEYHMDIEEMFKVTTKEKKKILENMGFEFKNKLSEDPWI